MTTFHTEIPKNEKGFHGEYLVGKALENFSGDTFEAWFQVDYLPGVTEIDTLIFHPDAGLFLLETKGVKIDSIATYDLKDFVLYPNSKRQHPVVQVRTGLHRVKNYLQDLYRNQRPSFKVPFIQASVIWPVITRAEWDRRFTDEKIRLQAKSMIFQDDLASPEKLLLILKAQHKRPLLGILPQGTPIPTSEDMERVRKSFSPTGEVKIKNDSLTTELRREVLYSKQLAANYQPPKRYQVSFEGPPGTGKSTVLREIGLLHAAAGGQVLHVCFSKVLAADQRREYQILKRQGFEYGLIEVFDEWELYRAVHPLWEPQIGQGLEKRYKTGDEIAQEIWDAKEDQDSHPRGIYDTILIDESQDLSQSIFKVLEYLARPTASWFVSYGEGQEIFLSHGQVPSPFLREWLNEAERKRLRRSFRNSTRAFLVAQNFWENYSDLDKSSDWFDDKLQKSSPTDSALELELNLPKDTNDFRVARISNGSNRLNSIKTLLLETIEAARLAQRGADILIAVGTTFQKAKNLPETNYQLILRALFELQETLELEILDLVPKENRRNTPNEGTIRIARHQNIRGLSASHVLIFDLPDLEEWCSKDQGPGMEKKGPLRNYGYIAFSRSRVSTVVVLDDGPGQMEPFIEKSLIMVKEKFLKAREKGVLSER